MKTFILWDGVDCGENAKPTAQLWKEVDRADSPEAPTFGYSLDTGIGDDIIVLGFATEDDARSAARADVRERMLEASIDADASLED